MIRDLTAEEVTFEVVAEQDELPLEGNVLASGDEQADKDAERDVARQLAQGNVWAWAFVRVIARWQGYEGSDCLGGCSYASEEDFRQPGGYFDDMKVEALARLNDELRIHAVKLEPLQVKS